MKAASRAASKAELKVAASGAKMAA